jgi:ABC-2 type transport system permease protein
MAEMTAQEWFVVALMVVSVIAPLAVLFNRQVRAVFKREVALYFRSPIAYAIAFALMFFMGILFSANLGLAAGAGFQGGGYTADQLNLMPATFAFLLFLVAPLLTMRLLAEENREGTLEVLMTLPMGEWTFIVGKFLAVWAYYTVLCGLLFLYYLMLLSVGSPDPGKALGGYYGLWLYGGGVLAATMIWSAVTQDQIVAAFLSAATVLILYLADIAARWFDTLPLELSQVSGALASGVREMSLQAHFQDTMFQGIVRAQDILYFVFLIGASLFITTLIVGTRRWRA